MDQIPPAKPVMDDEMIEAAASALRNERLVMGESVFKFEEAFAKFVGVKNAISLSSGTDALIMALLAMDCAGGEIVTSSFSFIATANSIVHASGIPVFHDVKSGDFNLDADGLAKVVTKRTRGIMPVHIFGHPCDMNAINDLAEERGVLVIEDACQAHGATYRGRKTGSLGHIGCFSFYPTKNMTVGGDGGMVTTNDDDLAKSVAKFRDCGRVSRYLHDVVGYTSRLNTANAAIGLVQLNRLEQWNDHRRNLAERYNMKLKDVEGVSLPPMADKDKNPVYHLYVIRTKKRDELANHLTNAGIVTAVHYPTPIHLQPVYTARYGYKEGAFPVSELLSKNVLSLPMFPSMTNEQVDRVCETIINFFC